MSPNNSIRTSLGVVVIGRNEGERLRRCLDSVQGKIDHVVYVDSGSSDDSVAMSRARGAAVVELDMGTPFTAARARNEGFSRLLGEQPELEFVFFVDGDCEVVDGWLDEAFQFLSARPNVAVVCGQRTERYPDKSVYNMLIDLEWKVPSGQTRSCGGDSLMRVDAFREAGGFRPDMICGEEPELCYRLRHAGWLIWCLDSPMTLHDAAIYRIGQWWMRSVRTGFGYAHGFVLYGRTPERFCVRECYRIWGWGFLFPLIVAVLSVTTGCWAMALLAIYPLRIVRIYMHGKYSARKNWWRAISLVLGQPAEFLGQLEFVINRFRRVQNQLIEYK